MNFTDYLVVLVGDAVKNGVDASFALALADECAQRYGSTGGRDGDAYRALLKAAGKAH